MGLANGINSRPVTAHFKQWRSEGKGSYDKWLEQMLADCICIGSGGAKWNSDNGVFTVVRE